MKRKAIDDDWPELPFSQEYQIRSLSQPSSEGGSSQGEQSQGGPSQGESSQGSSSQPLSALRLSQPSTVSLSQQSGLTLSDIELSQQSATSEISLSQNSTDSHDSQGSGVQVSQDDLGERLTIKDNVAPGMARCFSFVLRITDNQDFRETMLEMMEVDDTNGYEEKFRDLLIKRFHRFCPQPDEEEEE